MLAFTKSRDQAGYIVSNGEKRMLAVTEKATSVVHSFATIQCVNKSLINGDFQGIEEPSTSAIIGNCILLF